MDDKKENCIIKVSPDTIDLLNELREVIAEATSIHFAESLSWGQLSNILTEKIRKANIKFSFP